MIDPNATTLPPELPPSHEESTDSLLREVAATPAVSPVAAYTLRPGVVLAGRYRIESLLGRGGMGTVFRALDTRLGRPVAIKVHHGRASALERLRQEARALAQLSHPNVVTVLEVGSVDGSPFVVMEFVDGANARQWRDAGERSWQEIVALYREAGLGLAAAHRVGLVHRDFKPDNVLVGHDGRPRVADFGLANLRGITVADVPNLFFLLGPNTGLGHNSVVFMIESQIRYVGQAIAAVDSAGAQALAPTRAAQDAFNAELQDKLAGSVWSTGGCSSWYLDEHGKNRTLWSGMTWQYWLTTRSLKAAEYRFSGVRKR